MIARGDKIQTIIKTGKPKLNFQKVLFFPEQSMLKSSITLFYLFSSSPILMQVKGTKFERNIFSIE